MKNFTKIALSAVLGLAVMLPALANTTTIELTATVADTLSVQIIQSADSAIVSKDDDDASALAANLDLDFGSVDARGISNGTLAGNNGGLTGVTLSKAVIEQGTNQAYLVAEAPSQLAGALYYIDSTPTTGYSVLTTRSGASDSVNVSVTTTAVTGNMKAFVATDASFTPPAASTPTAALSFETAATPRSLITNNGNNNPVPVAIGLFVENATTAGAHTTLLTFEATAGT